MIRTYFSIYVDNNKILNINILLMCLLKKKKTKCFFLTVHFDSHRSDLSTLKYSNKELKADIEKCKNW